MTAIESELQRMRDAVVVMRHSILSAILEEIKGKPRTSEANLDEAVRIAEPVAWPLASDKYTPSQVALRQEAREKVKT